MKYFINQKLNFFEETREKQSLVKSITAIVKDRMHELGYSYIEGGDVDIVFSVGGDGTMMHTIRNFSDKDPIFVGVNAGNIGFLDAYDPQDVFNGKLFDDIIENSRIEARNLIEYTHQDNNFVSVNEISLKPRKVNDMIHFSMEVCHDNENLFRPAGNYKADALLLSTSMGSTAYNMNAGGAIMDSNLNSMQFTLVAPTLLGSRSVIFDKHTVIKIKAINNFDVYSDNTLSTHLNAGDEFIIYMSKRQAKILLPADWNFFSHISKKLNWNNGL